MLNNKVVVGIDLTKFNGRTDLGIGRYIEGLLTGLRNKGFRSYEFIVFTDKNFVEPTKNIYQGFENVPLEIRNNIFTKFMVGAAVALQNSSLLMHAKHFQYKEARSEIESRVNCLYTPTTYLNFRSKKIPTLVSIHDIQSYALPHNFSTLERLRRNINTKFSLRYSSMIQVSSNFVESEILEHFKSLSPEKIIKIPEGVNLRTFSFETKKYLVPITIFMPAFSWAHKNHEMLFRVVEKLPPTYQIKFFLTISKEDLNSLRIQPLQRNNHMVVFLGRLSKKELEFYFKRANYVLSCSLYESSSLPILEGIASGCAVIASNIPAHSEMASSFDMQLFDTNNYDDLKKILLGLGPSDFKATPNNYSKLKSLDWGNSAELYLKYLNALATSPIQNPG
jgi:glycosyltransferase involved in cell wall biosynthesis